MSEQRGVQRRDSISWAAGESLARLDREVGVPGRAAMAARPDLLARVDQHAAQVRQILADATRGIALTALAGYVDGVLDVAAVRGVDPLAAARSGRWKCPPWPLVRLLAVCQLAESDHIAR